MRGVFKDCVVEGQIGVKTLYEIVETVVDFCLTLKAIINFVSGICTQKLTSSQLVWGLGHSTDPRYTQDNKLLCCAFVVGFVQICRVWLLGTKSELLRLTVTIWKFAS